MLNGHSIKNVNIVWFKKDLRVSDHRPLAEALEQGPTIGVFVVEDEWLHSAEFSYRHYQFALDCLIELRASLAKLGVPLIVRCGDVFSVFSKLSESWTLRAVYSHEETGVGWTYKRDLRFNEWCHSKSIPWLEFQQFAVLRGLKNRDLWNKKRDAIVARPLFSKPKQQSFFRIEDFVWDELPFFKRNSAIQKGGEGEALKWLESFLYERGELYTKNMSTPVHAYKDCSRISPYLVWGALSLPQVHIELNKAKRRRASQSWMSAYRSFESRLWWHCHFIQKLESEPEIEFENVNRGFDGMREGYFNESYFEAWKKGETGYPMIDACMRALVQTGWINFRMRALLISFASYQLWLHWRKPAQYLASLFTDFEPGIHFSQIQMQSGVTGINTIRIYSPIKQGQDQDPDALFIKKFCPELEGVPSKQAIEPHKLTAMEQIMYGFQIGKDYPAPIVDHAVAYKEARDRVFEWRSKPKVRSLAKSVYQKHGSRKNNRFPSQHRKPFGNFSS